MPRAARLTATLLLLALVAASEGCFGPTLPLPPPTALVSAPAADGFVEIRGSALADAYVLALDLDRDEGVIGRASGVGDYRLRVQAASGETIEIWQMAGTDGGQHTTVVVPDAP